MVSKIKPAQCRNFPILSKVSGEHVFKLLLGNRQAFATVIGL